LRKGELLEGLERRGVNVGDLAGQTDSEIPLKAIIRRRQGAVKEAVARRFINPEEPFKLRLCRRRLDHVPSIRKEEHPHFVLVYAELKTSPQSPPSPSAKI